MTMTNMRDTVVRDLAMRYADIAGLPEQSERRGLWRRHNSLKVPGR